MTPTDSRLGCTSLDNRLKREVSKGLSSTLLPTIIYQGLPCALYVLARCYEPIRLLGKVPGGNNRIRYLGYNYDTYNLLRICLALDSNFVLCR